MAVDIHKSRETIEWARQSVSRRFSTVNADITCRFLTRLRLENKSYGRVANYADCMIRILKIKDDSCITGWSRTDIEEVPSYS